MGGIQGFPARAWRMAVKTATPCLAAVEAYPRSAYRLRVVSVERSRASRDPARPASTDDPATGLPAHPNIVTGTQTTDAAVHDVKMTGPVDDQHEQRGLAPGEHAVDSAYASAAELIAARERGITLTGPLPADTSRQARAGGHTTDMLPSTGTRSRSPARRAPSQTPGTPAASTAPP